MNSKNDKERNKKKEEQDTEGNITVTENGNNYESNNSVVGDKTELKKQKLKLKLSDKRRFSAPVIQNAGRRRISFADIVS